MQNAQKYKWNFIDMNEIVNKRVKIEHFNLKLKVSFDRIINTDGSGNRELGEGNGHKLKRVQKTGEFVFSSFLVHRKTYCLGRGYPV